MRDVMFSVRMTEAERAAIKAAADQVRRSSSDLVRLVALAAAEQLVQPETEKGGNVVYEKA